MLIEVHYGDDCVLLVNGNCRGIHLLDYIRSRCHLPSSIAIDLCLINRGEPFHLSSFDWKLLSFEPEDITHLQCILTRIDDQGAYIPLSNNSKLINNELLTKLKKATNSKYTAKILCKTTKQSNVNLSKQQPRKRRRSLKTIAIAAAFVARSHR